MIMLMRMMLVVVVEEVEVLHNCGGDDGGQGSYCGDCVVFSYLLNEIHSVAGATQRTTTGQRILVKKEIFKIPENVVRWEREGASGWSYEEVLPYFKKAQTHSLGGDQYKGKII